MKRRLIVHAGTPKTGSTAFQNYFAAHRAGLKSAGILYPFSEPGARIGAKHQWVNSTLYHRDWAAFEERLRDVAQQCDERTTTILLSCEGIYTRWGDFDSQARDRLARLRDTYDCYVWLWFREPVDFCTSWFAQTLKNPRFPYEPEYGRDRSIGEFLADPWVAQRFDYARHCDEMERCFGDGSLFAFAYSPDIVGRACDLLKLDRVADARVRENETALSQLGVDVLRVANRYRLEPHEKRRTYALASRLSSIVGDRSPAIAASSAERDLVARIATMTQAEIVALSERSVARWDALDVQKRASRA